MIFTHTISVRVSSETARLLQEKVDSGEYASEDEIVEEALAAFYEREATLENWLRETVVPICEATLENWLRETVVPICEAMERDPSQVRTSEQVRATLAEERARYRSKQ